MELSVIAHYINCGYRPEELIEMSYLRKVFFLAAWELEVETSLGQ